MRVDLSSTARSGGARERLLARLLDTFDDGLPPPETSLREIATRTGTSHALLRYHFGSLAGTLAAMLEAQRTRDNERLFKTAELGTFHDLVLAIWRVYTRPEQLSRIRGFFHVVGLAATVAAGTVVLLRVEESEDFLPGRNVVRS